MNNSSGALAAAAILVIAAPASHAQSTAAIARMATPATVTIVTLGAFGDTLGLGSGFVVRSDGVIVTNYHVMRGAYGALIRFSSGAEFPRVEALAADPERDLAILKVAAFGIPALELSTSAPVVGDQLVVIGAPRGLDFTVSEGIVSAIRRDGGREWIQMSAPISPGSSGGPVLDFDGNVVGVTTAYREDGQALNFAVPIRYVEALLRNAHAPTRLATTFGEHATRSPEQSASASTSFSFSPPSREATAEWLVDSYLLNGRTTWSASTPRLMQTWTGLLLLPSPGYGLLVHKWDGEDYLWRVLFVRDAFATDRGRVLVDTGEDWTWQGYFTGDGGIAMRAINAAGVEGLVDSVIATPHSIPLDNSIGLYDLSWRTRWISSTGERGSGNVEWSGTAALAVVRDSVYISLYVENAHGGSTSFVGTGPIDSRSHFSLRDWTGSTLVGEVGDGRVTAKWQDLRESGARFVGTLQGTRE